MYPLVLGVGGGEIYLPCSFIVVLHLGSSLEAGERQSTERKREREGVGGERSFPSLFRYVRTSKQKLFAI